MKVTDLRRELASRDLPTEGLKKDLAFRLASLDNADDCRPSELPHPTSASLTMTSNKEGMLAKTEDRNVPITEVGKRSPGRPPSSQPVDDQKHGDKDRRISNVARWSTAIANVSLSILLIVFLSYVLSNYISTVDQAYFSRSIDNGYDLLCSEINHCQDFVRSQIQHGYYSIYRGTQHLGVFMKRVRNGDHPPRILLKRHMTDLSPRFPLGRLSLALLPQ